MLLQHGKNINFLNFILSQTQLRKKKNYVGRDEAERVHVEWDRIDWKHKFLLYVTEWIQVLHAATLSCSIVINFWRFKYQKENKEMKRKRNVEWHESTKLVSFNKKKWIFRVEGGLFAFEFDLYLSVKTKDKFMPKSDGKDRFEPKI